MKVWNRAGIELLTTGPTVGLSLATDCSTGPGDSSNLNCYNEPGMVHCAYQGVTCNVRISKLRCTSVPEDYFYPSNADPDEMPQYAASHLHLNC